MLILLVGGTLASLAMGMWRLWHADALAAFFLYQMALGLADLTTVGLRSGQQQAAAVRVSLLWLATLASAAFWPNPWWELAAVAAAAALVAVHRPDIALFAVATLPVSLVLLIAALLRSEPFPWTFLALLLGMGALCWWQRRCKHQMDAP